MNKAKRAYQKEHFLTLLLYIAISLNYVYFDMFYELGDNFKDLREVEQIELVIGDDVTSQPNIQSVLFFQHFT